MHLLSVLTSLMLATGLIGQELSPYELPADVAARIREVTGGDPKALLAGVGSTDLSLREKAEEHWDELDERAQCALTRAGLRSPDDEVAIGAAVKATDNLSWLDSTEIKRAARAGMARCNVVNTPFGVADFFDLFDAEDTGLYLASPGPRPREVPQFFGPLHHRFGPEHISQIEQHAHGDDVLVRQEAERSLGFMRLQRLRYAHVLLSRPIEPPEWPVDFEPMVDRLPYEPRRITLRSKGDGFPPVLAALLEDLFSSGRKFQTGELTFAWRWAVQERAGELDRELLVRLAEGERDEGRRVAVHGLRSLRGADVDAALAACASGDLERAVAPFLALGELARREDADAFRRLAELSPGHPLALAVLWQVGRDTATAILEKVALAHALAAVDDGAFWGVPMAGVEPVLIARGAELSPADLGRLLRELPAARTDDLLARGIAVLDATTVEHLPLGVLEFGGAEALAARLHAVLADADLPRDPFEVALGALARLEPALLGDDATVAALFDRCDQLRERIRSVLRIRLAAARGDAVRERALARLDEELVPESWRSGGMLATAVAACGVADRAADGLFYNLARNANAAELTAARDAMVAPLRRSDGVGAIAAALAADAFGLSYMEVWTLPDEVALPALRRGLEQRERGEYLDAISQLARRGDAAARAEIESAIRRRLYGWIDRFDRDALTDGKSLERVPLLLSQADANCCTFAVIASALEEVFEVDAFVGESGVAARPERLRATWERHRENLRWSRIDERWLIVPR